MLEARRIIKRLGHHQVLRGVDLTLRPGETVVVFGANGAGKTTLIRILASLLRPDMGEIEVMGRSMRRERFAIRPLLGLVTHQPLAYLGRSPYQNLWFLGRMYGVPDLESRILQLLKMVGLLTYAHEPLQIFSRGMTQRFMIARALIHDPPVLLFDEPFSGLDVRAQQFVAELIRRENESGRAVLLTTHATALGHAVGDRYLLLEAGKIEPLGTSQDTPLEELQQRYQRRLQPTASERVDTATAPSHPESSKMAP